MLWPLSQRPCGRFVRERSWLNLPSSWHRKTSFYASPRLLKALTLKSSGPGSMQRYLFELLYESEKPMTFAAIRRAAAGEDFVFRFTVERSLRRNLKRMVDNEVIVANGDRYGIHPKILAIMAEGGDDSR